MDVRGEWDYGDFATHIDSAALFLCRYIKCHVDCFLWPGEEAGRTRTPGHPLLIRIRKHVFSRNP